MTEALFALNEEWLGGSIAAAMHCEQSAESNSTAHHPHAANNIAVTGTLSNAGDQQQQQLAFSYLALSCCARLSRSCSSSFAFCGWCLLCSPHQHCPAAHDPCCCHTAAAAGKLAAARRVVVHVRARQRASERRQLSQPTAVRRLLLQCTPAHMAVVHEYARVPGHDRRRSLCLLRVTDMVHDQRADAAADAVKGRSKFSTCNFGWTFLLSSLSSVHCASAVDE